MHATPKLFLHPASTSCRMGIASMQVQHWLLSSFGQNPAAACRSACCTCQAQWHLAKHSSSHTIHHAFHYAMQKLIHIQSNAQGGRARSAFPMQHTCVDVVQHMVIAEGSCAGLCVPATTTSALVEMHGRPNIERSQCLFTSHLLSLLRQTQRLLQTACIEALPASMLSSLHCKPCGALPISSSAQAAVPGERILSLLRPITALMTCP